MVNLVSLSLVGHIECECGHIFDFSLYAPFDRVEDYGLTSFSVFSSMDRANQVRCPECREYFFCPDFSGEFHFFKEGGESNAQAVSSESS